MERTKEILIGILVSCLFLRLSYLFESHKTLQDFILSPLLALIVFGIFFWEIKKINFFSYFNCVFAFICVYHAVYHLFLNSYILPCMRPHKS
jgi:hypothetical protein